MNYFAAHLTTTDAATVASVNEGTIRRWVRAGKLRGYRAGRVLRAGRWLPGFYEPSTEIVDRIRWEIGPGAAQALVFVVLALLAACGDHVSQPDGAVDASALDASPADAVGVGCTASLCVGADAGACAIVCAVGGPAPSGWGCNASGACACAPGGTPACTP